MKQYENRNKEERQFIALDLVMRPEEYENVPLVEAEQMHFDEDYHTTLNADDLRRINMLPPYISMALPFLLSRVEVEAHRLLNKYTRGMDDDSFREQDARTPVIAHDHKLTVEEIEVLEIQQRMERAMGKTLIYAYEVRDAIKAHDALLRAASRDLVREKCFDDDDLTEEERDWLQLDKMLFPHIYTADELSRTGSGPLKTKDDRDVYVDLSTSLLQLAKLKGIVLPTKRVLAERSKAAFATKLKTHAQRIASAVDGDVWDEMRLRYDTGEEVFDYSWLCPFTREQVLDIGAAKDFDDVRSLMHGTSDDFAGQQTKKDIQYVWRLMKKYYVSDEDTHMGRMHLETLLGFDRGMQAMMPAIDEAASANIDEMNRLFDEESARLDREEQERHQRYPTTPHTHIF